MKSTRFSKEELILSVFILLGELFIKPGWTTCKCEVSFLSLELSRPNLNHIFLQVIALKGKYLGFLFSGPFVPSLKRSPSASAKKQYEGGEVQQCWREAGGLELQLSNPASERNQTKLKTSPGYIAHNVTALAWKSCWGVQPSRSSWRQCAVIQTSTDAV